MGKIHLNYKEIFDVLFQFAWEQFLESAEAGLLNRIATFEVLFIVWFFEKLVGLLKTSNFYSEKQTSIITGAADLIKAILTSISELKSDETAAGFMS